MGTRLTLGLSEDRDFEWPRIPAATFRASGPYRSALARLNALTSAPHMTRIYDEYWQRCLTSGGTLPAATKMEAVERLKRDIAWILVLESESARIWSSGPEDYRSRMRTYQQASQADLKRVKSVLEGLKRLDVKHSYLLRMALDHAMQDFLSDEKIKRVRRYDSNTPKGFTWYTLSGPKVREHELQYLSRLALFNLSELLDAWGREVDDKFKPWPVNWMEFGALRFEKAIGPKAAAKLNVVQLGLIAHLTSRLRDFTAGHGIWVYSTGQPIPAHGKPCWDIVAEFVNCALSPSNPLTGDTTRRIWQKFFSKHPVKLQGWPKPAKAEPQVQKT